MKIFFTFNVLFPRENNNIVRNVKEDLFEQVKANMVKAK